jgi:drug/metabolite transporter (DMT)-like permease
MLVACTMYRKASIASAFFTSIFVDFCKGFSANLTLAPAAWRHGRRRSPVSHARAPVVFAFLRRHAAPAMPSAEPTVTEPRRDGRRSGARSTALLPFLLLALASLFWAGNWVVGRALREVMPPVAMNFWRWTGAALILAPIVLPRLASRWHSVRQHWRILALLGGLGAALFQVLVYLGLGMTTTVNAVLMNSSVPLFIMLCSWWLERERATPRQIAGILVSFAGILIIMKRGDLGAMLQFDFNRGDLVILAAMPAWGVYSVLLKRRPREFDGLELLFVLALVGVAWLTPFFIAENLFVRSGRLTVATVGAGVYVSLFASVLGYVCWNKGVAAIGANRAGFTIHLLPAFGTLLAIVFLGEEFHLFHLAGFATIIAGIGLATSARTAA